MIDWIADRIFARWGLSLAREMEKEAIWLKEHEHREQAILMVCLAAAINRADGKLRS